jgi:hypothetical protein
MKRPSGWMDDGSGGRSQGLLHLHPQKYTGAESGVAFGVSQLLVYLYRGFSLKVGIQEIQMGFP